MVGINVFARQPGHGSSGRRKFKADNRDNGAHARGREDNVNPAGAGSFNKCGKQNENNTEHNKAGLRIMVAACCHNCQNRGNKSKAGTEIGRNAPFGDEQIQQRADTVHKQAGCRAYVKQKRNEHR